MCVLGTQILCQITEILRQARECGPPRGQKLFFSYDPVIKAYCLSVIICLLIKPLLYYVNLSVKSVNQSLDGIWNYDFITTRYDYNCQ